MAYVGFYKDRNPCIIAAGVKGDRSVNIKDCFLDVSLADKVAALKREFCPGDDEPKEVYPPRSTVGSKLYEGLDTDVAKLMSSPVRSQTDQFNEEFKNTMYDSYWNKPLGKGRDSTANLPPGFDPLRTTLGNPSITGPSVRELVNPPKLPGQVSLEADIGHDMYVKTHKDYYPGEQVGRNYLKPPFDPQEKFGIPMSGIASGSQARNGMKMHKGKMLLDKRQVDYNFQHHDRLGKAMEPNHILGTLVTHDYAFGKPCTREMYGIPELLKNCKPCLEKRDEEEYMRHINTLRVGLKKFRPPISFFDMKIEFLSRDVNKTGVVPLSDVYAVCDMNNIYVDRVLFESLMRRVNVLTTDGDVDYKQFVAMLDWRVHVFPVLTKLQDVPPEHLYYESSYQAANKDLMLCDSSEVAGLPSARYDLGYTVTPIMAYQDSLGDETNVHNLLNPTIFMQYGLSHRDFFMPRSKNFLQEVFTNIGVALPDEQVDELYRIGRDMDKTGGVCVETFRNLLDELACREGHVGTDLKVEPQPCPCEQDVGST